MNQSDSRSVGSDNLTEISQEWAGDAIAEQFGDNNRITIEQGFLPYGGSVAVYQDGGSNEAAVNQQGGRYYIGEVELTQLGSANRAQVTQWAGFSSFTFAQEGSGNVLNARQTTRDGIIRGHSVGNDNRVNINQSFDGPVLDIAQNGSANEIDVVQHTAYSTASITQTGDGNVAVLNQTTQFDYQQAPATAIIQNGTGNSASITQRY
ncbi:hypothetical protein [Pseudomonas songnenensis]|uniref:hypothetical protein n=1 Tax=Pseudomonas songnenensis TaxID=1176259 RepID=UPI0028ABFD2A|nr:hypothetical protein [Pseudomonas songnenensis]